MDDGARRARRAALLAEREQTLTDADFLVPIPERNPVAVRELNDCAMRSGRSVETLWEDVETLWGIRKQMLFEKEFRPLNLVEARAMIFLANPYDKLDELLDLVDRGLSRPEALHLLGEIWQGCPNLGWYQKELRALMPDGPVAEMMTAAERALLANLPETVTAYRGADQGVNEEGLSWAIKREFAEAARRWTSHPASRPVLLQAAVRRDQITAVKRAEGTRFIELIVKHAAIVSVTDLQPVDTDRASAERARRTVTVPDEDLVPPLELFWHASEIHGRDHVARVLIHAFRLVGATGLFEEGPRLWAAVYLHDLARQHDGVSPAHGGLAWRRLAELPDVRALFARGGVRDEDYPAIQAAVTLHSTADPTRAHPFWRLTALLKDADALDRVRIGDLNPAALRHPEARERHVLQFAAYLYRNSIGFAKRADFTWLWTSV
jgi:hypothetical protein